MQDEINSQIVALSIRTGKETARITTRVLQAAIRKYLQDHKQRNPTLTHGKQTVGQLMEQNSQLTNIEVTDQNIKSFERVAKKYNIDFALKKDKSIDPPRYLIFFTATYRKAEKIVSQYNRDLAQWEQTVQKKKQPAEKPPEKQSVREQLRKLQEEGRKKPRNRSRDYER